MRAPRVEVERIHTSERVNDSVDAHRPHELADERVADVELEVVRAAEVVPRLADVDTDHLGDVRVFDEALHGESSPPARDSGDEDASLLRGHREISLSALDYVALHLQDGAGDDVEQGRLRLPHRELHLAQKGVQP